MSRDSAISDDCKHFIRSVALFCIKIHLKLSYISGREKSCYIYTYISDTLFCSVSLLEIEVSLTLCQPKLALKQAVKLRDSTIWRRANIVHCDYLDCLEYRIRCRLAQTSSLIDFSSKPEVYNYLNE